MIWNREELRSVIREKIGEHKFVIVSNREPYIHIYSAGGIKYITPASGMTTALDPVMTASGGTWVAAGMGEADREVVDSRDRVQVPPEAPSYTSEEGLAESRGGECLLLFLFQRGAVAALPHRARPPDLQGKGLAGLYGREQEVRRRRARRDRG